MRKKGNKTALTVVLVIVMGISLLGMGSFSRLPLAQEPVSVEKGNGSAEKGNDIVPENKAESVPCVNPVMPVPDNLHIHPHLQIIVGGRDISIPANIGLALIGCERVLHTHDDTGEIHVEPNFPRDFTLGDFFGVWGKTFSADQILDYKRDAEHEIVITVDGRPSHDFEKLVLQDKQQIVIEYRKIAK